MALNNEDTLIALELEARILKAQGLVLPGKCGCRFSVLTSYPGRPWYLVRLVCAHTPKHRHTLYDVGTDTPMAVAGQPVEEVFGWFTGAGEPVSIEALEAAYDEVIPPEEYLRRIHHSAKIISTTLDTSEGFGINRHGGAYFRERDELRYIEPKR